MLCVAALILVILIGCGCKCRQDNFCWDAHLQNNIFARIRELSTFKPVGGLTSSHTHRWHKLIDQPYIISIGDKWKDNYDEMQGFGGLLTVLETVRLADVPSLPVALEHASLVGCHIGHTLCAEHARQNSFDRILIMEDDAHFTKLITDEDIDKLVGLIEKHNPAMVNMAPLHHGGSKSWTEQTEMALVDCSTGGSHLVYLSGDGIDQITATSTKLPDDDDVKMKNWFGADDFWTHFGTNTFNLAIPDMVSWAVQKGNAFSRE